MFVIRGTPIRGHRTYFSGFKRSFFAVTIAENMNTQTTDCGIVIYPTEAAAKKDLKDMIGLGDKQAKIIPIAEMTDIA